MNGKGQPTLQTAQTKANPAILNVAAGGAEPRGLSFTLSINGVMIDMGL